MASDRTIRYLGALSGAASSRVFNLTTIGLKQADNSAHWSTPLFASPIINGAINLKHRLRSDETDSFISARVLATKVIIPFEKTNLASGGRSMFVDQRGFEPLLRETGNYRQEGDLARDIAIFCLIDRIPSLDPFLLREQLRSNDIAANSSYFEISEADQRGMFGYAATEIRPLDRPRECRRGPGGKFHGQDGDRPAVQRSERKT